MRATLLQGLLLVVTARSQESCRTLNDDLGSINISDIVEMEVYFYSSKSENYKCYESNNSNKLLDKCDPEAAYTYCSLTPLQDFPYPQVCKLSKRRTFLPSTVVSVNTTCTFSKEICDIELFWPSDLCQNLSTVLSSHKKTLNTGQSNITKIRMEGKVITEEIINNITMYWYEPEKRNDDRSTLTPRNSYTKPPKTWYIYEYPKYVTVHFCLEDVKNTCGDHSSGVFEQKNQTNLFLRWKKHFCELSSCSYEKVTFCRNKLQIDFTTNTVQGLPRYCKYTDGFCKYPQAFWEVSDRCRAVKQVAKAEMDCDKSKCLLKINATIYQTLEKGKLCDENVWYTNRSGILAADKELQFFPSNNQRKDPLLFYAFYSVETLGSKEYLIMVPLALAFFWCFFGIVVCFLHLCFENRRRKLSYVADSFEMNHVEDDETKYETIRE